MEQPQQQQVVGTEEKLERPVGLEADVYDSMRRIVGTFKDDAETDLIALYGLWLQLKAEMSAEEAAYIEERATTFNKALATLPDEEVEEGG